MRGKLLTFLGTLLFTTVTLYGQCAMVETISVCDITVEDGDMDGNPDGIINLFDQYNALPGVTPITPADGMWFDPGFNFALDVVTGDLFTWDLDNASEAIEDYQFEFVAFTSTCPDDILILLNVVIGPYSGDAASTTAGGVNLQVCQVSDADPCGTTTNINLFETLLSNPSPHINGTWSYTGTSPNFIAINSNRFLEVSVPYSPGPPLVDEETFEMVYTVPGISPCAPEQQTFITVSVVREPFAGFANNINICETSLIAGDFDIPIDLTDDAYLVNENIEGIWLDEPTGQISGPGDSVINLSEIYDQLYASNQRFGCQTFEFPYFVESRSTVCPDQTSVVSFTFYEFIRPFTQNTVPEFCVDEPTQGTINLYDLVEFTTENGVLYDYPDDSCTNWEFVSGPSNLGLVSNLGDICSLDGDPNYTSQGTIDLSQITTNEGAGTYVFRFTVDDNYHCATNPEVIHSTPDGCIANNDTEHPCESHSTLITIVVNPINYAGEPTSGLEFCETELTSPFNLIDLLETNGIDDPVYEGPEGIWTDIDTGAIITNPFTLPEITDQQTFNFEYNTTTTAGCTDQSTLSFTVYEQYNAGDDAPLAICPDGGIVDLFDLLTGDPNDNGSWTGPAGYTSATNNAPFDPSVDVEGDYIYTVPDNVLCPGDQATVTVTLAEVFYAGEDTADLEFCTSNITAPIDLITLLDTNGVDIVFVGPEGVWTDIDTGVTITNPFVIPTITGQQTFNFQYNTTTANGCEDQATLMFTIFEQFEAGTDATIEICPDGVSIDLFDSLAGTPDTNGTWTGPGGYTSSTNNAPFDPAINEEGNYIYTVPSNGVCDEAQATVTVMFFDVNYAGEDTTGVEVCESVGSIDLITLLDTNGVDTIFTSGVWTDIDTGVTITNPFVIPTITGQQTFNFQYNTTTANGCEDQATLMFTIFEQFEAGMDATIEICPDGVSIDLFDSLAGTPDTNGTWTGPGGYTSSTNNAPFDPAINEEGNYIYTVPSNGVCDEAQATVTVMFFDVNYAGEDTTGVEVCESVGSIDLITLLDTNGVDTIFTSGVWTDTDTGATITNPFVIPVITGQQAFNFQYDTTTANGCDDQSTLTFTVFESGDAGAGTTIEICVDQGVFNLFDLLSGTPDTDGTWTGPNGYTAAGVNAVLNPATNQSGDYVYEITANGVCPSVSSTITVTVSQLPNVGEDISTFLCPGDYDFDLTTLLDTNVDTGGEFIDLATSVTVPNGIVDVGVLGTGDFTYTYIASNGSCTEDSILISITITAVAPPIVNSTPFCINEGVTLGDLEVANTINFAWYDTINDTVELPLSTVLVNGEDYFVNAIDENGCESERVSFIANILPLSDATCDDGISDGVSDNDDGTNDELELGTLPVAFPNFEIKIFNRYGSIVYEGNQSTPLFNGESNTGITFGNRLPTGVYFYIFDPRDGVTQAFDGNFYLSR